MLPRNVWIRLPTDCVVCQLNGRLSYTGAKNFKTRTTQFVGIVNV